MTTSTCAYTGFFIVAVRSSVVVNDVELKCKNVSTHPIKDTDHYCSKCGGPVIMEPTQWELQKSLNDVQSNSGYEWIKQLDPQDISWLNENYTAIPNGWTDNDDDLDYIIPDSTEQVDCDNCFIADLDVESVCKPIPVADITKMCKILGYTSYVVRFGTIVTVS